MIGPVPFWVHPGSGKLTRIPGSTNIATVGRSKIFGLASTCESCSQAEPSWGTSSPSFSDGPESKHKEAYARLSRIDPSLRWQASDYVNYEAQQAPLAYAILALPERAFATIPLSSRVLVLRMVAGTLGALLLVAGAERLSRQLHIGDSQRGIAVFCALSSQMIWAALAHVTNEWLAVPLTIWLLVTVLRYHECPDPRRVALASVVLSAGLLTRAYFIAFLPAICIF